MIVRPLPPTQRTSNTIRPTSQDFAPPTAFAKTQAHQVYSIPISTLSKLCCTPMREDNDPKIIPRSATVCTRLKPIAARFTHSQPGVPTGVRVLSILLPPPPQPEPKEPAQSSQQALEYSPNIWEENSLKFASLGFKSSGTYLFLLCQGVGDS